MCVVVIASNCAFAYARPFSAFATVFMSLLAVYTTLRSTLDLNHEMSKPFKTQLATTDALIDQVVYRLYGLTADEI
jgi:hypothetical protein